MNSFKYVLVHFVIANEHLQPLLQSQVFEQAELQKSYIDKLMPVEVKVMYYCHYRDIFNGSNSNFLRDYRQKYPSIKLVPIYRPIRYSRYFKSLQIFLHLFSKHKTIVHCRGEAAHKEIRTLPLLKYLNKKTVLDIRGIWPYENLLHKGITDLSKITLQDQQIFKQNMLSLVNEVKSANGLSFVSETLRDLVVSQTEKITTPIIIVPCVTRRLNYNINTEYIGSRKSHDFTLVYVGTDRSYQHLGDIVFPFVKLLMLADDRIKLKILSKDKESILCKLRNLDMNMRKIQIKSLKREMIFQELEDCHLALLLRQGNVVNKVSSPVKLGEYLACGLPILYQKDSIGFGAEIINNNLGLQIDLDKIDNWAVEVNKVIDYLENDDSSSSKKRIQTFFNEKYCWENFMPIQRIFYREILNTN